MIKAKLIVSFLFFLPILFTLNNVMGQASVLLSGTYSVGNKLNFDTYDDCIDPTGKTATKSITIQYDASGTQGDIYSNNGYTLKVSSSDFVNNTGTIQAQYIELAYNSSNNKGLPVNADGTISLSNTPTALVNFTSAETIPHKGSYSFKQFYDITVVGGPQLLVSPTGDYTGTLTFSYCDASGNVITSSTVMATIEIGYSSSCSGVTLTPTQVGANPTFTDYASTQSGISDANALKLIYQPNACNCIGWSLKVRTNGDFVNSLGSTISSDHVSFAFNHVSSGNPSAAEIGVTNVPVTLSTSDVTLINNSQGAFVANHNTTQLFDININGGSYLLFDSTGDYSGTLTFSIYNAAGNLVATANANITFTLSYSNGKSTISLNTPDVTIPFTTAADYVNGVSVTETQALEVVAAKHVTYQVVVQTQNDDLTDGTHTIPVSTIKLSNTANPVTSGITSTDINLSTASQVIISNTNSANSSTTTDYDLTYSVSGWNNNIIQSHYGTYTTQVVFVLVPN